MYKNQDALHFVVPLRVSSATLLYSLLYILYLIEKSLSESLLLSLSLFVTVSASDTQSTCPCVNTVLTVFIFLIFL